MSDRYSAVYLSPHLDDAVLSCGGRLWLHRERGERALVVTLFAGDPPTPAMTPLADRLHHIWKLEADAPAARRAEDTAALAALGVDRRHETLPECIYRRDPATGRALYPTVRHLFGAPDPADAGTRTALAERLAALPPHDHLYAPLGIGRHVDHVLLRDAAILAVSPLAFYEDYPYVERFLALRRARRAMPEGVDLVPEATPLSPAALVAKCAAIACYTSQVPSLFGDMRRLAGRVERHAARSGGERLWRRSGR